MIIAELTDGNEVFKTQYFASMEELNRAQQSADKATGGNLYWRVICPNCVQ